MKEILMVLLVIYLGSGIIGAGISLWWWYKANKIIKKTNDEILEFNRNYNHIVK